MPVRPRLVRFALALLLPLVLGGQAAAQRPAAAPPTPDEKLVAAMHGISSHTILDWVKEMVSDKYEGRLTGTPSYDASAAWAADLLKGWGFKPAGDGGTYFQKFPNPYTLVKPGAELKLHIPAPGGGTIVKSYVFEDEYYPGLDVRLAERDGRGRVRGLRHHGSRTRLRRLQRRRREGQVRGLRARGRRWAPSPTRSSSRSGGRTRSTTTR